MHYLGKLSGYKWIISSRGYANILDSKIDYILGLIYEISVDNEVNLDKKKYYKIEFNGNILECLVYIAPLKTKVFQNQNILTG